MDTPKAAEYLDLAAITLAIWRGKGKGPDYFKIGGRISYTKEQLDAFIQKSIVRPAE